MQLIAKLLADTCRLRSHQYCIFILAHCWPDHLVVDHTIPPPQLHLRSSDENDNNYISQNVQQWVGRFAQEQRLTASRKDQPRRAGTKWCSRKHWFWEKGQVQMNRATDFSEGGEDNRPVSTSKMCSPHCLESKNNSGTKKWRRQSMERISGAVWRYQGCAAKLP